MDFISTQDLDNIEKNLKRDGVVRLNFGSEKYGRSIIRGLNRRGFDFGENQLYIFEMSTKKTKINLVYLTIKENWFGR